MARFFIDNLIPQLLTADRSLFAFVFDMNILFERFVANFLQEHRNQIFLHPYQETRIVAQAASGAIYLAERMLDSKGVFALRPDIQLMPNLFSSKPFAAIDTKYKRLNPEQTKLGVSESDFYQMLAYALRLECGKVLILYPEEKRNGQMRTGYQIPSANNVQIFVETISLNQPLNKLSNLIESFQVAMNPLIRS